MELNYESRKKLRNEMYDKLFKVPNGEKIKLSKELLETILFEVTEVNEYDSNSLIPGKVSIRVLAFDYDYINKLDLSEISFDNVAISPGVIASLGYSLSNNSKSLPLLDTNMEGKDWCGRVPFPMPYVRFPFGDIDIQKVYKKDLSGFSFSGIDMSAKSFDGIKLGRAGYASDLSNSNAKIKLDKLDGTFNNCNFENLDLSDSIITEDMSVNNVNFKGTNIKVKSMKNIKKCNLESIDLSKIDFSDVDITYQNLKDTGANIDLNKLSWSDCNFIKGYKTEKGTFIKYSSSGVIFENGKYYDRKIENGFRFTSGKLICYDNLFNKFEYTAYELGEIYIDYLRKENKLYYLDGCYIDGVLFDLNKEIEKNNKVKKH